MKLKAVLWSIFSLVVLIAVAFILNLLGLEWTKFFKPKRQNIERKVFEETKSYVHGVIQDLGKYYSEYQEADDDGKMVIKNVIKVRFAEFDANHISISKIKRWFIATRGY